MGLAHGCRLLKQQLEEEVERVKTAEAALSKEWAKASSSRGQGRAEALAPRAPRSEQEQRQLKELQWAMATQAVMQRAQQSEKRLRMQAATAQQSATRAAHSARVPSYRKPPTRERERALARSDDDLVAGNRRLRGELRQLRRAQSSGELRQHQSSGELRQHQSEGCRASAPHRQPPPPPPPHPSSRASAPHRQPPPPPPPHASTASAPHRQPRSTVLLTAEEHRDRERRDVATASGATGRAGTSGSGRRASGGHAAEVLRLRHHEEEEGRVRQAQLGAAEPACRAIAVPRAVLSAHAHTSTRTGQRLSRVRAHTHTRTHTCTHTRIRTHRRLISGSHGERGSTLHRGRCTARTTERRRSASGPRRPHATSSR